VKIFNDNQRCEETEQCGLLEKDLNCPDSDPT
jgi:hypothetical protein